MISLSNLLKQNYFVNVGNGTRVINSDEKYEQLSSGGKHGKQEQPAEIRDMDSEELLDGFLAGLEAEEVLIEPKISPEELLEQAKAEADEMIAAAKAEARAVAEEAKMNAEALFEQMKAQGYETGREQLRQELEEKQQQLEAEYLEKQTALDRLHEQRMAEMESDIVDALISVFNRVFDIQFDNKKQILLYLIHNTLMNVEVGKEFHIRVSSANYKFIESHIGDIKEKIGNDISVEIVNDMTMGPEDCVIETESGVFNCGIDMELSNLEKDIRSLCS